MKQKVISILIAVFLLSGVSNAQTIREKIDIKAKDPKTAENAAKADVYIVDKKVISDKKSPKPKACKSECRKARKAKKPEKPGN